MEKTLYLNVSLSHNYGITDKNRNLRPAAFTMQEKANETTMMRAVPEADVIVSNWKLILFFYLLPHESV